MVVYLSEFLGLNEFINIKHLEQSLAYSKPFVYLLLSLHYKHHYYFVYDVFSLSLRALPFFSLNSKLPSLAYVFSLLLLSLFFLMQEAFFKYLAGFGYKFMYNSEKINN